MRVSLLLAVLGLAAPSQAAAERPLVDSLDDEQVVLSLAVPIDHTGAIEGSFNVHVEFGAPYDASKPTVFLIADGQQFFVRPGAIPALQERLFGPGFNVVGIVGRHGFANDQPFLALIRQENGDTDWEAAWALFRAEQWIEDIEFVRRNVFGVDAPIMLFGRSGGGYLVHQYLHAYPSHVSRAFTSAPAATWWTAYAGVRLDFFWDEIGRSDASAQARIHRLLEAGAHDRQRMASAFQRQNFFVPHNEIDSARLDLLATFESGDPAAVDRVYEDYQVAAIERLFESVHAVPTRVRLFEFALPFLETWAVRAGGLDPDIEVMLSAAQPLIERFGSAATLAPSGGYGERQATDGQGAEVFVLAGRWDHVVDYRGALALSASYPRSSYWLADDNHTFDKLVEAEHYTGILRSFMGFGLDSAPLEQALHAARDHRWSGD